MPARASAVADRIAGAPISWGVCEVPDWGYQLSPTVVLAQMRALGLAATEFGPDGFLPEDPAEKVATLSAAGLRAVGQFVPVVLHERDHDPLPELESAMSALLAANADTVVLAATTGLAGYDERPDLDAAGWGRLLGQLERIAARARERGLTPTLHPHVGTMIASGDETQRVIDGSSIGLCLDTGHLLIGGGDPVAVARAHPDRIAHCHLKDVRIDLAERVRTGGLGYSEAVAEGMYVPLGRGDVDIAAIVAALEAAGYTGWYVLEQDTILSGPPERTGIDPAADVRLSIDHLLACAGAR